MAEKADKASKEDKADKAERAERAEKAYVSDQVAIGTWSIIARFLHEGTGILTLHKAWDRDVDEFLIVPFYSGQTPESMKPNVWMTWRHELKAPLGGHAFIRDVARVVETVPLESLSKLGAVEPEHALTGVEAERRFREGESGLVGLVLRVYHLPRAYKLYDIADKESAGERVALPFDVAIEDLDPAVEDADFERRLSALKAALR